MGDAAVAVDAALRVESVPSKVFIHGSGRCGECHDKMFDEWEVSGHAQASTSPVYRAAVASVGSECGMKCHDPLSQYPGNDSVASEGVTCDVCHTLREPVPSPAGGSYKLAVDDMVKYGPRCDLKDHYFHRMGCSKVHSQAEICGSCHWYEPKGLPVFTEFKDWRDGPEGKKGTQCQACHMPDETAALAQGSPVRTGVPHHGLLGLAGDLRKRMVSASASTTVRADGALQTEVHVTNTTAGHYVPAGLPEHRIRIGYEVLDASGHAVAGETVLLGRQLVDDKGALVPFWRATKEGVDTRIAPGQDWTQTFTTATVPDSGSVVVAIEYLGLDPGIADLLKQDQREVLRLTQLEVPFGAKHGAGRAKLPRSVTFSPPVAGKRKLGAKKAK